MIDKVPETTTLECTLPKACVERVAAFAREHRLTIDEAIGEAIDQSCERWELEAVLGPAEVMYSDFDLHQNIGTPVKVTRSVTRLPDPPTFEDDLTEPRTLPLTNPRPIEVHRGPPHQPDPLVEVADV